MCVQVRACHQWQPAPSRIDSWLIDYNAALATICFMLFLGFADDVLDIPWRVKLVLPLVRPDVGGAWHPQQDHVHSCTDWANCCLS